MSQVLDSQHDVFTRPGETVFRIVGSSRDGQLLRVRSPRITIGSGANCTLRLRARGVRPLHCLVLRGTRHTIMRAWHPDTRLNGRSVRDAVLTAGDRLTLGPVELEFVGAGENVPVDPPKAANRRVPPKPDENAAAGHATLRVQADPAATRVPHAPHDERAVRPILKADGEPHRSGSDVAALETLRRDYDLLQEKHAAAQAEIARLRAELKSLREANAAPSQESSVSVDRQELEELRTRLKEWEAELVDQENALTRRREAMESEAARLERERAQLAVERKTIAEQRDELEAFRRKWQEAAACDSQQEDGRAAQEAAFQAREQTLAEAEARLEERLFAVVERESQAEQLLEEIGKQEETIKEREARLIEHEEALEKERASLESQREQLQRREQRVAQQEKELSLRAQTVGQTNALAEQREELALRERSVAQQAKAIEDRADRLAALEAELEQREATIRRLQEELDRQREMLHRREEALREREEAFARRLEEAQGSPNSQEDVPAEVASGSNTGLATAAYLSQTSHEPEPDDEEDAPPEVLSVLRRFGKRKEEPQPATSVSTAAAESDATDDGEESVEEYMKNLLARLRGTTPDAVSLTSGSEAASGKGETREQEQTPIGPQRRPVRMRPRTAPERQADLAAMRELANSSSVAALNSAAMRRVRETMRSRLAVALVSYASGGSLLYLWMRFVPQAQVTFYAAITAFILGVFWTIQFGVLFLYQLRIRQALTAAKRDDDDADREIGASCRMIYRPVPDEESSAPERADRLSATDEDAVNSDGATDESVPTEDASPQPTVE
ncbi:hypothetical protein JCM19992_06040 [Thermostilla marina]